jgi:hypothetical protein
MSTERKTQVERDAYKIWEQEGRPHGRDKEHWHRAERDVKAPEGAPGASAVAATTDAGVTAKRKAPVPKDTKPAKPAGAKAAAATKPAKTPAKTAKPAKAPAKAAKPAKTTE